MTFLDYFFKIPDQYYCETFKYVNNDCWKAGRFTPLGAFVSIAIIVAVAVLIDWCVKKYGKEKEESI